MILYTVTINTLSKIFKTSFFHERMEDSLLKMLIMFPAIANCKQSKRIALSNGALYDIMSHPDTKTLFYANESDNENISSRIDCFFKCSDGNPLIVKKARLLASLVMIQDYYWDMEKDHRNEKYNPYNDSISGRNYISDRQKIMAEYESLPQTKLDEIFPYEEAKKRSYWLT